MSLASAKDGSHLSDGRPIVPTGQATQDTSERRLQPAREEGATERSDYADPKNYKYPLHTESNVRAAISYFSKPKNAGMYPPEEQKRIWGRIKSAAKKHKIELSEESGPPSVEKSCGKKHMAKSMDMDDWLEKAKYIRREGSPGNYRYYYDVQS